MGQTNHPCPASIAGAISPFLMALRAAAGALKQSVGKVAGEQRLATSATSASQWPFPAIKKERAIMNGPPFCIVQNTDKLFFIHHLMSFHSTFWQDV